jgi:hypothetical protein
MDIIKTYLRNRVCPTITITPVLAVAVMDDPEDHEIKVALVVSLVVIVLSSVVVGMAIGSFAGRRDGRSATTTASATTQTLREIDYYNALRILSNMDDTNSEDNAEGDDEASQSEAESIVYF